jgi:hypothetical protein
MYYITYRNMGKPEVSPKWNTLGEAKDQAAWAKECGMTHIKIIGPNGLPVALEA